MKPVASAKNLNVSMSVKTRHGRVLETQSMRLWEACILFSLYMKHGYSTWSPNDIEITLATL